MLPSPQVPVVSQNPQADIAVQAPQVVAVPHASTGAVGLLQMLAVQVRPVSHALLPQHGWRAPPQGGGVSQVPAVQTRLDAHRHDRRRRCTSRPATGLRRFT